MLRRCYVQRIIVLPFVLAVFLCASREHLLFAFYVYLLGISFEEGDFFPLKIILKTTELDNFSALFFSFHSWSLKVPIHLSIVNLIPHQCGFFFFFFNSAGI